ncbi:SusE domain-containing protein [Tenacibaculum tangerinum]|uniref:SusE domain-containing protein n=1 Tax=Tenacibaculum tangerinum TaxID=3038772 RepID=A0ABY8L6B3_9FLAO|nr:SusE domain-containing protein [Tenacibaculum tangerinum]WGH76931.1 SusE domain-containing protein [Tenacibaculum tangerinum]
MTTKNLYITKIVAFFLLVLVSCQQDDNLQPEGEWELSTPAVLTPSSGAKITLDENTPSETVMFSWEAAESSVGYGVTYEVLMDEQGGNFTDPIFVSKSSDNGNDTSFTITYEELNKTLAYNGYPANSEITLAFAVKANSLSKSSMDTGELKIVTFTNPLMPESLYISGTATEDNGDLSQAIELQRLTSSDGTSLSNKYEIYTSLKAGESYKFYNERSLPALQYGGSEGNIEFFGNEIVAEDSGQYRITVDLDNNTYELLHIEKWSMVGQPINGGWGGDEPLEYQGDGIWKASINLFETGGFVFRANGDWGYLLKRVVGTPNTLVMERDASSQGLSFEDIPNDLTGTYIVTLDLSPGNYNYTFERDGSVAAPIDTPSQLFLLENGTMIEEFTVDGNVFSSNKFIPLQSNNTYTLNSASDGSGTSYSVEGLLASSDSPDDNKVSDVLTLVENNNTFTVVSDRAIRFSIDFSAPSLTWTYYNFRLFHWDQANEKWDDRQEFLMTYSHPNTYTVTADLSADYDSKFISPWDYDLGSDAPSALAGNLIKSGGSNIVNITNSGTYTVTMILNDDYETGTYEFKQ